MKSYEHNWDVSPENYSKIFLLLPWRHVSAPLIEPSSGWTPKKFYIQLTMYVCMYVCMYVWNCIPTRPTAPCPSLRYVNLYEADGSMVLTGKILSARTKIFSNATLCYTMDVLEEMEKELLMWQWSVSLPAQWGTGDSDYRHASLKDGETFWEMCR